jgi:hypothetical protein
MVIAYLTRNRKVIEDTHLRLTATILQSELYIDMNQDSYYSSNMKWVSIILLIVLAFTVLAPLSSFSLTILQKGRSFLANLDVCHSAAPALSSSGEMPCANASLCSFAPTVSISTHEPADSLFTELILTSRNEQPPKA